MTDQTQRDRLAQIYAEHFGEELRDLDELDWPLQGHYLSMARVALHAALTNPSTEETN